jgi:AraC family transcriptional regulator of adaptative response / DNA-3-methyladenine glycosylase II
MAGREFGVHLPGVGPWTAAYVALRLGDDDAFLPTDLGVKHGLAALGADPARAEELAEAWRPFRAFAVAHLWATAAG